MCPLQESNSGTCSQPVDGSSPKVNALIQSVDARAIHGLGISVNIAPERSFESSSPHAAIPANTVGSGGTGSRLPRSDLRQSGDVRLNALLGHV
ncbi:hypothetical protein SprV_0602055500 [Sparganum proliferum]